VNQEDSEQNEVDGMKKGAVRRVYHRKTVEVRIMKISPYGSPIALVFAG